MELFREIVAKAREAGASDVHLKERGAVVFRIEGELVRVDAPTPSAEWLAGVLAEIVPLGLRRSLEEKHEVDFSWAAGEGERCRINVFQQRGSLALSLRLVKGAVPDFETLGLPDQLRALAAARRGIVLVAGATGTGKSTTLAAMVEHINASQRRHIVTLEDPIEYLFQDRESIIEQREIGLDTGSFADALRHVLRQDPDVIMIGEMRDAVSFEAALSAAGTGHLVLSTVHSPTAPQAVSRVLEFYKADEREQIVRQIGASLRAVVCQRLIPAVAGGMVPAVEILVNNATVRRLLEENKLEKLSDAIEVGREDGMMNFNQSLLALVKGGRVSEEVALAHSGNPDALRANLRGIVFSESRRILR